MESQPPETRLKVLEDSYERLDERVTVHGREIDALREQFVRTEERDVARDRRMASIETKVDQVSGKLDAVAARPAQYGAEKWDKATWIAISGLIMAAIGYLASRIGL